MQHDAFSRNVYKVIDVATALAKRYGTRYIGSEHILFGLLNVQDGRASSILKQAGVDNERYLTLFARGIDKDYVIPGNMFTARTKRLLEKALDISLKARSGYVGTEHLLLAVLMDYDSMAVTILRQLRVDTEKMAEEIANNFFAVEENEENEDVMQNPTASQAKRTVKEDANDELAELSRYGVNLNKKAESHY